MIPLKEPEWMAEAIRLREEGIAFHKIAHKFGVSDTTVRFYLNPNKREAQNRNRIARRARIKAAGNIKYGATSQDWSERLIEPWQAYTARKKAERAAAKQKMQNGG